MGLFSRKKTDTDALEQLRAELRALQERLDATEAEKHELADRLGTLDESNSALTERVDAVSELSSQVQRLTDRLTTPPSEPPPPPPAPDDERLSALEDRLVELDELQERLTTLSAAVAHQAHDSAADDEHSSPDVANRIEDLSAAVATHYTQLAAVREQLGDVDELRTQLGQMAERMTALDRRLTGVSTELANQLDELSHDIESLDAAATAEPAAGGVTPDELATQLDAALAAIRNGQEKLAAEQARYEIKFREDLAELAERLRRPSRDT